jgi:hypothetical protein
MERRYWPGDPAVTATVQHVQHGIDHAFTLQTTSKTVPDSIVIRADDEDQYSQRLTESVDLPTNVNGDGRGDLKDGTFGKPAVVPLKRAVASATQ